MQFHLNGFLPGDPSILPIPASRAPSGLSDVDVLIVGCGPAGLTLAAQLSAFPDIRVRIVERKPGPLRIGQADGIACRTMEMFQAFGFAERVARESYWVNETTFWKPDAADPRRIARHSRIQDTEDGLSEFPHVILNQARVHDFLLETMRNSASRLEPDYEVEFIGLDRPANTTEAESHPVTVRLKRLGAAGSEREEVVKARYVVGCDGARSAVRKAIGLELRGDSANSAWGVMDVLAITDFPDIRMKAAIQSASQGSMLVIPREGGYLVRFYVELDKLAKDERVASRSLEVEDLVAAANRIAHPYRIDVKEVAWWSVYEIGQRLCDRFDDGCEDAGRPPRVFIAGDSCHTHSPKAGQGMNVSMADGFNLGWKLAAVIRGTSPAQLLLSYSAERRKLAQELIDFDREFAAMFSARPAGAGPDAQRARNPAEVQRYFVKQGRVTAGTAVRYEPSAICADGTHQGLASGYQIGMRFHSAPVVRLADAKPLELSHRITADGRWRIVAFAGAGDPFDGGSGLSELVSFLDHDQASPVRRYTPLGDADAVIEVIAVLQQAHREVDLARVPPFLQPAKGRYGLTDYEKVHCADQRPGSDIFDLRGIDREQGCMVVVRPDQYVADVLPLTEVERLSGFFERVLREPAQG